jgi:adenylate kinase
MQPLTVIFLGKAGSGKGTQAGMLSNKLGMKIIGTGELLRSFIKLDLPVTERVEETLRQGHLVPSWLATYLWTYELLHSRPDEKIIFDGSPRKIAEALMMDDVLEWCGRTPIVFLINLSDEEALKRLEIRRECEKCRKIYIGSAKEMQAGTCSCGGKLVRRHDDELDAIKTRLDWFKTEVMPCVEHFRKRGLLIEIDGKQSPEAVLADILKHLDTR